MWSGAWGGTSHILRSQYRFYLRVALPAILADVRLEVLGLLVLRNVLEERGLVDEAFVARVALVRLVSLVAARVGLQVRQLGEGLRATWGGQERVRKQL